MNYEFKEDELDEALDRIIKTEGLSPEQATRICEIARDEDQMLYLCDECNQHLAVLSVDQTVSELAYDEDGELIEEAVDGEPLAKLCRGCAGDDARYVAPRAWE